MYLGGGAGFKGRQVSTWRPLDYLLSQSCGLERFIDRDAVV